MPPIPADIGGKAYDRKLFSHQAANLIGKFNRVIYLHSLDKESLIVENGSVVLELVLVGLEKLLHSGKYLVVGVDLKHLFGGDLLVLRVLIEYLLHFKRNLTEA